MHHEILIIYFYRLYFTSFIVLFLGITKALMSTLFCFMKHYGHGATFENFINPFLKDIASFRVDYCVLKKIPNTLWVSENYIGMARIFPWAFGLYCLNFKPTADSIVHDQTIFDDEVLLMKRLINSFSVMIANLMSRNPNYEEKERDVLDKQIKIFLTTCSNFCSKFGGPSWETKGNFYSLLNLPDQILQYGPLRDYCKYSETMSRNI